MCRFFPSKKNIKQAAFITISFPAILIAAYLADRKYDLVYLSAAWLVTGAISAGLTYKIGTMRQCPLPHLPQNVVVENVVAEPENHLPEIERFQAEGDLGEEEEMRAPAEILPNAGLRNL